MENVNGKINDLFPEELTNTIKNKYFDANDEEKIKIESQCVKIVNEPIVVYKKISCSENKECIAELIIPKGATIVKPIEPIKMDDTSMYHFIIGGYKQSNKMRVSEALVTNIKCNSYETDKQNCASLYSSLFEYKINEVVKTSLNINVRSTCKPGIHVFATRKEA